MYLLISYVMANNRELGTDLFYSTAVILYCVLMYWLLCGPWPSVFIDVYEKCCCAHLYRA